MRFSKFEEMGPKVDLEVERLREIARMKISPATRDGCNSFARDTKTAESKGRINNLELEMARHR